MHSDKTQHESTPGQWQRHGLVWPRATSWQQVLAQVPAAHQAAVRHWAANNWPLVLARQNLSCDQADAGIEREPALALGLPLPIDHNGDKAKIGLRLARTNIRQYRSALSLACVLARLAWAGPGEPAWAEQWQALKVLQQACDAQQLVVQVYGSWAWQAITGLPYLHAKSDLDLLFTPQSRTQLASGLALLQGFAAPMRLDGELLFADGSAVAWREWVQAVPDASACTATAQVLVKRHGGLALRPYTQMLAMLAQAVEVAEVVW